MALLRLALATAAAVAASGSPAGKQAQAVPALQLAPASSVSGNRSSAAPLKDWFCSPCISFGAEGLQELTELLAKGGVGEACDDVCGQLDSPVFAKICNEVCDHLGIQALADLLKTVDLDIFYFCYLVDVCTPGPDDASIRLGGAVASPASASAGGSVQLSVPLTVEKPSGPGQFVVQVRTPALSPLNGTHTVVLPGGILAGTPALAMKLPLSVSSAKGGLLEGVPRGMWTFEIEVCQGECGSTHPHSKSFGTARGKFEVDEAAFGGVFEVGEVIV